MSNTIDKIKQFKELMGKSITGDYNVDASCYVYGKCDFHDIEIGVLCHCHGCRYFYYLAIVTFEKYMQNTGKWNNFKEFKELMEENCPVSSDFEDMFSHFWGYRQKTTEKSA